MWPGVASTRVENCGWSGEIRNPSSTLQFTNSIRSNAGPETGEFYFPQYEAFFNSTDVVAVVVDDEHCRAINILEWQ